MSRKSGDDGLRTGPPTDAEGISGFVCPHCLATFDESSFLMEHFNTQHGETESTDKVFSFKTFLSSLLPDGGSRRVIETPATSRRTDDPPKHMELDEERSKLIASQNDELLHRLLEERQKIQELEAVTDVVLDGAPLPNGFRFRSASLERRFRHHLESSADQATLKSIVESQTKELQEKADEIQRLRTERTDFSKSRGDERDRLQSQVQTQSMREETLKAELEALKTDNANVVGVLEIYRLTAERLESQLNQLQSSGKDKSDEVDCATTTDSANASATVGSVEEPVETPTDENHNILSAQLITVKQELKDLKRKRSSEVDALSRELESIKTQLATAVEKVDDSSKHSTALSTEVEQLKGVERQLRGQLVDLQNDRKSLKTTIDDLEKAKASLEVKCVTLGKGQKELESLKTQLATAVQKVDDSSKQSTVLSTEVERLKHVERQLRGQLVGLQNDRKGLEKIVVDLETAKASMEVKCVNSEESQTHLSAKLRVLQSERDELAAKCDQLTNRCVDLETKLSAARAESGTEVDKLVAERQTAQRELDSLMLRLIKSEDQCKVLEETIGQRTEQIEKLKKVTCELGRENQTLQILRERVSSRQWALDDQATACQACSKGFSLSSRKHHCRVCGGIFCQACSSQKASTAAWKYPVRVCDACFTETGKPS